MRVRLLFSFVGVFFRCFSHKQHERTELFCKRSSWLIRCSGQSDLHRQLLPSLSRPGTHPTSSYSPDSATLDWGGGADATLEAWLSLHPDPIYFCITLQNIRFVLLTLTSETISISFLYQGNRCGHVFNNHKGNDAGSVLSLNLGKSHSWDKNTLKCCNAADQQCSMNQLLAVRKMTRWRRSKVALLAENMTGSFFGKDATF